VPEGAQVIISPKGVFPERTRASDNYIGTEISTQFAAYFYDRIKLEGYVGAILPGQHYKDLCGTLIGTDKQPSGSDIGYVANIGLVYAF
jgi:hypothetical protein